MALYSTLRYQTILAQVDSDYIGSQVVADDDSTNSSLVFPYMVDQTGSVSESTITKSKLFFQPSTGQLTATTFNSLSDVAYKNNVSPIENVFDLIDNIDAVQFNWKDNGQKSYGVVAQQLEEIAPELVVENQGIKTVQYIPLIAVLIEAVKELKKKVDINN